MTSIVSLAAAKKKKDKDAYAALVLRKFNDAEHQDRRAAEEHRAEVERAARERL